MYVAQRDSLRHHSASKESSHKHPTSQNAHKRGEVTGSNRGWPGGRGDTAITEAARWGHRLAQLRS